MNREQRLVVLAFAIVVVVIVLALVGQDVHSATPAPRGTPLPESAFTDIAPTPRSAVQPASDSVPVAERRSGRPTGRSDGGSRNGLGVGRPTVEPSGVPSSEPAVTAGAGAGTVNTRTPTPSASDPSPLRAAAVPSRSGTATWYDWHAGQAAAGPALRVGDWRGSTVTVSAGGRSITVVLTDWCACPGRLIDLDRRSFAQLADPSRGVLFVEVIR